jgi:hypothetical protein
MGSPDSILVYDNLGISHRITLDSSILDESTLNRSSSVLGVFLKFYDY